MASARLAAEGIRTPHVAPISNPEQFRSDLCGLNLPLIVRDDCGHGKEIVLVKQPSDLEKIPFDRMRRPVAVEWFDVSAADGLFRKCRFVVAGTVGVRRHLIVSRHWEVRAAEACSQRGNSPGRARLPSVSSHMSTSCLIGPVDAWIYSGLLSTIASTPRANRLSGRRIRIRFYRFPTNQEFGYTHPYVERSLAAMTHMYLTAAGLPVPEEITARMNLHTADLSQIHQDAALMSAA